MNSLKKKIKNIIVFIIFIICAIGIIVYFEINYNAWFGIIMKLLAGLLLTYSINGLILNVCSLLAKNDWETTQKELEKEGKLQDETIIRISFAYLFRIKIDGKYFLVPNSRTGKYQPVGGAYKFNEEEANYLSANIPVENDDCVPVDKITKRDYRLLVKNKDLRTFIKRFNKTSNRENIEDLSREFVEEIFVSGILKQNVFGNLTYKYCGRHMTNIEETVFRSFEILLADIVEVRLTDKQEKLFRQLMEINSPKYKFATSSEIKSHGVKVGTQELGDNIANHTYKILSEKTDLLTMRNKHNEIISTEL